LRFDINLASRPFQDARSIFKRWGAILGGIACITAALVLIDFTHWRDNRVINEKMAKVQHDIDQLDAQRNANQALLNLPANHETRERSQFLNGIIMRSRVHLVKIEPELNQQNELKLKMTVEGTSRDKALDLVRKLETSNQFKQARIDAETAKTGSAAEGTVEFDISAVYVPPTPTPKTSAGRDTEEGQ